MKAVIYTRISDARQSDASLESQEEACTAWCARHHVEIAKVFVEAGASAKSANRPQFQRMFTWLEQNHMSISHVVCDKWDRFSRSMEDGVTYRMQLKAWRIELISATQPVTDDPAGRLMQNIFQSFGQFENEQRTERSVGGMRRRAEAGGFVNPAPLGYRNNGTNSPSLLIDEKTAPLIRGMYERVSEGHSLSDVLKWAQLRGLRGRRGGKVTIQTASRTLRNPAYAGRLELLSLGVSRQGDWEPLVHPDQWSKVQLILSGKSAPLRVVHTSVNNKYVLRGVIVCDTCGGVATASDSRSKSGAKYGYYHCARGARHLRISVGKADTLFIEVLERLIPNAIRLCVVEAVFRETWATKNASVTSERDRLRDHLHTLQMRKRRLLTLVQDGAIEQVDFQEQYRPLGDQIASVTAALADAETLAGEALDVDTGWGYLEHLLFNQHLLWSKSDAQEKRRIAHLIFPSGIRCSKQGYRTPVTHSLFSMLADDSVTPNRLVALTGIEPVF